MKPASDALIAVLASGQVFIADLFTFTLNSGVIWRFTSADADLPFAGNVFTSIPIARGKTRLVIGVQVDTLDISIYTANTSTDNISFIQDLNSGMLDGARVLVQRAFMANFGDTTPGVLHQFSGSIADVSFGRTEIAMTVKSDLQLLDTPMPRNLYQTGCLHSLFDTQCALAKTAYAVTNAAGSGSTRTALLTTLAQADGYFDMGTVTFTSGQNLGISYTVKTHAAGTLTLIRPTLFTPAAGDTFTAAPGCDKTQATCTAKFSNLANFRGYPYIPAPETAY